MSAVDTDDQQAASLWIDVTATLAMIGYSLVVALGFARVFSGWTFLSPLAVVTVAGFTISFVARRLGLAGWIAVPLQILILTWLAFELVFGSTMRYALPGTETITRLRSELSLVREQFPTAVAPVIYEGGWAWLALIGVVITVVMADAFAFRADARGEALVPGGVLFVFIAALADDRLRIQVTILLVFAGAIAVIALRARNDRTRRHLLGGNNSIIGALPAALATAAVVAIAAGWIGPRLPGATAEALYDTSKGDGGITNVTSPLVDIRSRLINQSAQTMFRVESNEPSYWRSTTLPEFDGTTFRLPTRSLERIESADDASNGVSIRQQMQIVGLQGVLVPAASDPVAASGPAELRLNRETNTLVSTTDFKTGDEFTIVSNRSAVTPNELRNATTSSPPDDIFIELPDDFPAVVGTTAAQVTASATTDYDKMLTLQNWFRSDFAYSTEIQPGHSTSAIEAFLERRAGYCEQFAATFASMARTMGIPSRVAVGFTQGELDESGRYDVLGKNAHAWPEIWFDGVGWVAFEPTPGRGAPGSEEITGVSAQQDENEVTPPPIDPNATTLPPTTIQRPPTTQRPNVVTDTVPTQPEAATTGNSTSLLPLWIVLGIGIVVALPWVVRRIRASRARHRSPTDRVSVAWKSAQRSTAAAGIDTEPGTTITEWADVVTTTYPVAARPSRSLAAVVEELSFAPEGHIDLEYETSIGTTLADDCETWARQIDQITADELSLKDRVVRYVTTWS